MFEDDAPLAARELGLTLTSRNNGCAAEVPLAGVPAKAATEYLRRLIGLGHRVAICEQVEDPKLAKGLVRRAVVETVTPGTVLADDWLERNRNNFLLAVDARSVPAGIAALDLTTGELLLETAAPEDLAAVLARYEPREVVLPSGTPSPSPFPIPGAVCTEREAWEFDPDLFRSDLTRPFRVASLDGLGVAPGDRPALGAVGALLRYARELKPGGLPHLARPRMLRRGDVLPLDEMTRRNLELVEPLRAQLPGSPGAAGTTLLDVLDRTMTPMGARLLRSWLLAPLVDPTAITARLDAVEVWVGDARRREAVHRGTPGTRARAHRHRFAQGRVQQGLRLLPRDHEPAPGPCAGGLRAAPDAVRRGAVRHARAQGVRGQGARCRGANRGARGGPGRCPARPGGAGERPGADDGQRARPARRVGRPRRPRPPRGLRAAGGQRRLQHPARGEPPSGGRAHDGARSIHPERRAARRGRSRDPAHRPEHGGEVDPPQTGMVVRPARPAGGIRHCAGGGVCGRGPEVGR